MYRPVRLSIKGALSRTLEVPRVQSFLRRAGGDKLLVFCFHRVAPSRGLSHPFDDSMYSIDAESFRSHLRLMRMNAEPISEQDLVSHVNGRAPLPRSAFMVTFDDGYRDNFEVALPIMKELGVPGIFFIPTRAIVERSLGWWDLIYWYLKRCPKPLITLGGRDYLIPNPITPLAETFTAMMKSIPATEQAMLLRGLREATGVSDPPFELADKQFMSWEQLRIAARSGIAIGSHTHSHTVLSSLPPGGQRFELTESKRLLESYLGGPVRSIAYPVGGYEHFNTETMTIAQECGFDLGFSFLTGSNRPGRIAPFDVRRVDHQTHPSMYSAVFSMPWLFAKRSCRLQGPAPCVHKDAHSSGAKR